MNSIKDLKLSDIVVSDENENIIGIFEKLPFNLSEDIVKKYNLNENDVTSVEDILYDYNNIFKNDRFINKIIKYFAQHGYSKID